MIYHNKTTNCYSVSIPKCLPGRPVGLLRLNPTYLRRRVEVLARHNSKKYSLYAGMENHALVSPWQQQNTISHFPFLHFKRGKRGWGEAGYRAALDLGVRAWAE
jgi:hypothetical protein